MVGDEGVMDCMGASAGASPLVNCGMPTEPKMKLWKGDTGLVPITIELAEQTGNASLKVEWKLDEQSNYSVIGLEKLKPNLGLTTQTIAGPDWSGNKTDLQTKTQRNYPTDDSKMRRLPDAKIVSDLGTGGMSFRTEFTYDDYGRKTDVTRFAGTADAATTYRTFGVADQRSCLASVEDPLGVSLTRLGGHLKTGDSPGERGPHARTVQTAVRPGVQGGGREAVPGDRAIAQRGVEGSRDRARDAP
jgi:hypothetical protein